MPTRLEWPSRMTTGSVRDSVRPFSGICQTCQEKGGGLLDLWKAAEEGEVCLGGTRPTAVPEGAVFSQIFFPFVGSTEFSRTKEVLLKVQMTPWKSGPFNGSSVQCGA